MSGYYEAYSSDRDVPLWAPYEDDYYDPDEDGPGPEGEQPAETGDGNWRARLNDDPCPF